MSSTGSAEQRRQLRRMKLVAGGLLAVAGVIFVVAVTVGDGHGAWGYVQAGAEAALVGGFADWFAVTALFRHPLGLSLLGPAGSDAALLKAARRIDAGKPVNEVNHA